MGIHMARRTVSIVLRLTEDELAAVDAALPPDVMRTWWIRGAIKQRLERDAKEAARP